MLLVLMRHGDAVMSRPDSGRPLSQSGVAGVKDSLRQLGNLQATPDLLISSPLRRARQTAEIVFADLKLACARQVWEEIDPSGQPGAVCRKIETLTDLNNESIVMLVTHQPFVSMLVEYLSGRQVYVDTATIVGISTDVIEHASETVITQGCGKLEWVIHSQS